MSFKDHGRVEFLVSTHEGGVDIFVDQVMCTQLCYVSLAINLLLDGLELDIGEICFNLEVEGGFLIHNEGPDTVLLSTIPIGHEQKL